MLHQRFWTFFLAKKCKLTRRLVQFFPKRIALVISLWLFAGSTFKTEHDEPLPIVNDQASLLGHSLTRFYNNGLQDSNYHNDVPRIDMAFPKKCILFLIFVNVVLQEMKCPIMTLIYHKQMFKKNLLLRFLDFSLFFIGLGFSLGN